MANIYFLFDNSKFQSINLLFLNKYQEKLKNVCFSNFFSISLHWKQVENKRLTSQHSKSDVLKGGDFIFFDVSLYLLLQFYSLSPPFFLIKI